MNPLYLVALTLNPRSRDANREVASAEAMHQRVWHLVPGAIPEGPGRLLWRVDVVEPGRHMVLVQCSVVPEPSRLPAGYVTQARRKRIDELLTEIAVGDTLRFRLRAAPAMMPSQLGTRAETGNRPGRPRIAARGEAAQVAWLARKMDEAGAQALSIAVLDEGSARVCGGAHYGSVRYDGLLRVRDPAKVRIAVEAGVGRGKSWGYGLLSLARPE